MTIIGVDNGITGSIASIFADGEVFFSPIPTKKEQSYTRKRQNITRVEWNELYNILSKSSYDDKEVKVYIERPYANPVGFKATVSAMRCLEAVLLAIEDIQLPYEYVDSKQWQKVMLPSGLKGTAELKKASVDIGCRLFPEHAEAIRKHHDADSLLMCEWARRNR